MATDYVARAGVGVLFLCLLWQRHSPLYGPSSNTTIINTTTTAATPEIEAEIWSNAGSPRPGLFVATGDIGDPPRSLFPQGDTAILAYGNIQVEGSLRATTDVIVQGRSLWYFWQALQADIAYVCGTDCLHGTAAFLSTCQCICEPHWSGSACDIHDCYGRGFYDMAGAFCTCMQDYEPASFCATHLCPNGTYITEAICTDSISALDAGCAEEGGVWPQCEPCATAVIDPGACPDRINWGRDLIPDATVGYMGVCGGGYTSIPTLVILSAMSCANESQAACQERWDLEAPICCAPGVQCTGGGCDAMDIDCCAAFQESSAACVAAGCAWCSDTVCAAPGVVDVDTDCVVSLTSTVAGSWQAWQYTCPTGGASGTVCDPASRDAYLAIYAEECGGLDPFDGFFAFTNITTECLTMARTAINALPWPRLQPYGGLLPGPTRLRTTLLPTIGCAAVLDMAVSGPNIFSAPAVWRCTVEPAVTRIILVNVLEIHDTQWLQRGSPVMIMAQDPAGDIYCLLNGPSNATAAAQAVGDTTVTAAAVFTRVRSAPAAAYCGQFRLDPLAVGIRTEVSAYGLSADTAATELVAYLTRTKQDPTVTIPAVWGPLVLQVTSDPV